MERGLLPPAPEFPGPLRRLEVFFVEYFFFGLGAVLPIVFSGLTLSAAMSSASKWRNRPCSSPLAVNVPIRIRTSFVTCRWHARHIIRIWRFSPVSRVIVKRRAESL